MQVEMFDGLFDGLPAGLQLDGRLAQVIVHGPGYAAQATHTAVSDMTDIIVRVNVTLSAVETSGVVEVAWGETVEADIDGATAVGGWVLSLGQSGADSGRRLLCYGVDPGGTPPDPYPVTLPSWAFRIARGTVDA